MNGKPIECKVTICGETETGKTCLMQRLINNQFFDSGHSTIGKNTQSMIIELSGGVRINFIISDTAGQEQFRSLNRIYFNLADIVILVYSIDNRRTFEEIKKYWINNIRNYGKKNPSIYTLLPF